MRLSIADCGLRPPASPSCRLYLRAGSRRGYRGLRPGGKAEKQKLGRWEDEKVGKKRPGSWEARKPGGQKEKSGAHRAWRIA